MQDLEGKAALVTGGSRGIGAAIARRLAARGADVAITYAHNGEKAAAVVADIEAAGRRGLAVQADSADPRAVTAAVNQTARAFGRMDILVNNAGIFPYGPPEDVTLEEIDRTIGIHVKAVFVASQAALRHMGEGGRIISIGSCFAQRVPHGGVTLYAMSKSALIGFTKGLAHDVGARGITVNVVDPGSTDTDMNPADAEGADGQRALTAVGHFGAPEDIASMVAHLASPESRFITGASLAVDGGHNA
ncbi:SDR family NAD(P)-dependent oxidoreductase [Nitratireductor pacificus]|uniref:SocA oxidoreductase, short chain dehydrogenase/reductase n=1 Tax=Nitratireductor pacificus pht-3B TaxID=391937 RepID=K2MJT3_9HYPH|nr:SDR family oxidoreductase [Nitratireductor pacificus]EKF20975.1 SocA oxidoreductase, short chain dehydrogenase/reductase [Nitratireductor pacificus pht-3B]